MVSNWQPIETAPKDGTVVLLAYKSYYDDSYHVSLGSYRYDSNDYEETELLWLKDDYDDFSTGYASTPLEPLFWMPIPEVLKEVDNGI